jgi:hypothetical protein
VRAAAGSPPATRSHPPARRRPSPSSPATGFCSQARPPFTACSEEYRDSGTGSATIRSAIPAVSTVTGGTFGLAAASAFGSSPESGPESPESESPASSPAGRPPGCGPNGDSVAAASGTR